MAKNIESNESLFNPYILHKHLQSCQSRINNRSQLDFAKCELNTSVISTAQGSAIVRLDNTTATCGIKIKVAPPHHETPSQGYLVANVELTPISNSHFRPGPPSEEAQALSQWLQNTLMSTGCPSLEDLVIAESRWVYVVYIDVLVTNADGCLHDVCLISALAALLNCQFPVINYSSEMELESFNVTASEYLVVKCSENGQILLRGLNLSKEYFPVALSWAIGLDGRLITQPSSIEEREFGGALTVVVNAGNKDSILGLDKSGGMSLPQDTIMDCVKFALEYAVKIRQIIEQSIVCK